MGPFYQDMPYGIARGRLLSHIQGVAVTPYGLAYSRNGIEHGQLIIPGRRKHALTQFRYGHAGGIDCNGDTIAIPLYDRDEGSANLCLWYEGVGTLYPLPRRPYAVGLECGFGGFIVAIVSCPKGSRIDWYRMPRRKGERAYDFHSLFTTFHNPSRAARNNICLRRGQIKHSGKPYGVILYTMRSYLGFGTVDRYAVSAAKNSVQLRHEGSYRRRNGLCASRFGATIRHTYRQTGTEVSLIRTARNIGIFAGENKLRVREDKIDFHPA